MYNSQQQLEEEMIKTGSERARHILKTNNEKGRASFNPTVKGIFKAYVKPLADAIVEDKEAQKNSRGPKKDYLKLLVGCEEISFSYLAVREVLSILVQKTDINNARDVSRKVGRVVQSELIFTQYKNENIKSYLRMIEQFTNNKSYDIEYKTRLARENLRNFGKAPITFGTKNIETVGSYLVDKLVKLGMLEKTVTKSKQGKKLKTLYTISLTEETLEYLNNAENLFAEFHPLYMPLIEKPEEWKKDKIGGYHTDKMKVVFDSPFIGGYNKGTEENVLNAINALQNVPWKVNETILDTITQLVKISDFGEIIGPNHLTEPAFPTSLEGKKKADMTDEDKAILKQWKRDTNEWHTENKRRIQKRTRLLMAIKVAQKVRNENRFYFLYQADFRGRMYARCMGINPQGSDLQKSLITFAEGKPLDTPKAKEWFFIHGANKAGIDKVPFKDRLQWVKDNHEAIMATANDPVGVTWWRELDSPFQFLAWALEYAELEKYGDKFFKSYIPIGMDGSCNGLQNYSAGFRDEVGAKSTNLSPTNHPQDIYQDVANVVVKLLQSAPEDDHKYRSRWLKHGIKRGLVKRSVMTLPYGSTFFACKEFIYGDYVKDVKPVEFEKKEYRMASEYLAKFVWEAIGQVVIKAREGMRWLQDCSSIIIKHQDTIEWETPSGFVVLQDYRSSDQEGTIRLALFDTQVKLYNVNEKPNKTRHRNGIAPNFIHSLDSCHMQAVTLRCLKEGITNFAMVHDDFGTHASDAEKFNKIIREEFYNMYQTDWFEKFYEKYKKYGIPEPPSKGNYNINDVLDSSYFFC